MNQDKVPLRRKNNGDFHRFRSVEHIMGFLRDYISYLVKRGRNNARLQKITAKDISGIFEFILL